MMPAPTGEKLSIEAEPVNILPLQTPVLIGDRQYAVDVNVPAVTRAIDYTNSYAIPQGSPKLGSIQVLSGETAQPALSTYGDPELPLYARGSERAKLTLYVPQRQASGQDPELHLGSAQHQLHQLVVRGFGMTVAEMRVEASRSDLFRQRLLGAFPVGGIIGLWSSLELGTDLDESLGIGGGATITFLLGSTALYCSQRVYDRNKRRWLDKHIDQPNLGIGGAKRSPDVCDQPLFWYKEI